MGIKNKISDGYKYYLKHSARDYNGGIGLIKEVE